MHEYYGHSQSGKTAAVNLRLCASILFLALALGRAQSSATANGSADISPARMRVLLQSTGVELTETSSSGDSAAFAFHLNGHNVKLHSQGKSIQLSACLADHIALIKQSQWTREHFSTGAYIDEQGCASLRAEVNFGVRVTDEMIEEFITGFFTDVTIYAKFVTEFPSAPNTPSAPPVVGSADLSASPIGPMEWSQLGQNAKRVPPEDEAARSVPGLLKINRNISLKYDPDRWRLTAPDNDAQLALAHSSGNAHALVIAERVALPRGSVEDIALENAQSVDPQAKIVFRQQRRINGADVRFLKIEAEVNGTPTVYWGCFYGGEYGTVQVVTYTAKSRLPEFEKEFMDILNGFTVSK